MVNATAVLEKHEHRGRITPERVTVLRVTARPTPLVVGVVSHPEHGPSAAYGCEDCGHLPGCDCDCCPYPLPAVALAIISSEGHISGMCPTCWGVGDTYKEDGSFGPCGTCKGSGTV